MRFLILGAGALGGYFGGRLIEAGKDAKFLVRPARRRQLDAAGLTIESPAFGNFNGKVRSVTRGEDGGPYDVVLLTCKAYDLDAAIDAIRPAVGPGTAILPVLNGLAHIDRLAVEFGKERVLGGLARIAATLTSDGIVRHLNDWRYLTFGELNGRLSERVLAIKACFDATSIEAKAVADIRQQMWDKIVHLATLAQMTTLLRANVGEIARTPGGRDLMLELLDRNAVIASRAGYPTTPDYLAYLRKLFSDPTATYEASMLRDVERHGPTEADHVVGYMLDQARTFGLDETLHHISYVALKAYDERRKAGRF